MKQSGRRGSVYILTSKQIQGRLAAHRDILRAAGVEPDAVLLRSMAAYIEILLRWNRKINLTSITDLDEIVARNFAESFYGARWLGLETGRLCDVGSGAGFPGMALKLLRPEWHVRLIEPSSKKAAFLAEVRRALELRNCEVECARWQDSHIVPDSLDAVTSRALGGHDKLVEWSRSRLSQGGKLLLWLGARDADAVRRLAGWSWEMEALPASRERVLLIGEAA